MFKKLGIWLAGTVVTPAHIRSIIDDVFLAARAGVELTPTPLDDDLLALVEKRIDKDALAHFVSLRLADLFR